MRVSMSPIPPQLSTCTCPKMIEAILRSSSDDFSFNISIGDLAIHNWVLKQRMQDVGFSNTNRFTVSSMNATDKVLLTETFVRKAQLRVQSHLFWETLDFNQSGIVRFVDASNTETSWIDMVVESIEPFAPNWKDDNHHQDFSKMTDSQIVELLCVKDLE